MSKEQDIEFLIQLVTKLDKAQVNEDEKKLISNFINHGSSYGFYWFSKEHGGHRVDFYKTIVNGEPVYTCDLSTEITGIGSKNSHYSCSRAWKELVENTEEFYQVALPVLEALESKHITAGAFLEHQANLLDYLDEQVRQHIQEYINRQRYSVQFVSKIPNQYFKVRYSRDAYHAGNDIEYKEKTPAYNGTLYKALQFHVHGDIQHTDTNMMYRKTVECIYKYFEFYLFYKIKL